MSDLATAKHYVISKPTGFQAAAAAHFNTELFELYQSNLQTANVQILASIHEDADKLALMTDDGLREVRVRFPGLVIEPNIPYFKTTHPIIANLEAAIFPASTTNRAVNFRVLDEFAQTPVADVTIYALINGTQFIEGVTDEDGRCQIAVPMAITQFVRVIAMPKRNYWSRVFEGLAVGAPFPLTLRALPDPRTEVYDWGHAFAGMQDGLAGGGAGVKVAVIDTGIRSDHPDLRPSGGRNCVFAEPNLGWDADNDGHGTHCAGVIASIINGQGIKGYAPNVELRAYRVFSSDGMSALTFDLVSAIQAAIDDGCDIISMSLGSRTPQVAVRSKIENAYENGVLCVVAAGNDGSTVSFPAAFPLVAAVGAFGQFGLYPLDSMHPTTESNVRSTDGQFFAASFSNFGAEVDFCAPGVAIRSTVPGGYLAMDGTSMACPQVAGMAALALSANPALSAMPRDPSRVDALLQFLKNRATPLGYGAQYEGAGSLSVDRLV